MSATNTISFQLPSNQTINVLLTGPQELRVIEAMAAAGKKAQEEAAELRKTYHLGTEPTKDRGYDDRLTMRTGYSRSTLLHMLNHGIGKEMGFGILIGLCAVNKWIVTEEAVRVCFGRLNQAA